MSNWNSYLKEYQNYLRLERGLSPNTIQNYSFDVEKLVGFLIENNIEVTPIKITDEQVQQFIYTISTQVNARSQSRIISGLKSFFNYLIELAGAAVTPLN
jgi:integrase/recombinase XerD